MDLHFNFNTKYGRTPLFTGTDSYCLNSNRCR